MRISAFPNGAKFKWIKNDKTFYILYHINFTEEYSDGKETKQYRLYRVVWDDYGGVHESTFSESEIENTCIKIKKQ